MILRESYTEEWIGRIQRVYKIDPSLVEKVIMALTLLEQLKVGGLDFIFKGGTSLMLLLGEIKRLSIDMSFPRDLLHSKVTFSSIIASISFCNTLRGRR